MFAWLKRKLFGPSSDSDPTEGVTIDENSVCDHDDMREKKKVVAAPRGHWEVHQEHLFVPQWVYVQKECHDCETVVDVLHEDGDTLVFTPDYAIAPDIEPDEALEQFAGDDAGEVIINRSENPA